MMPSFFYFDLGKVLVDFSVDRMCRQMGDVAGADAKRVNEVLFGEGLQAGYESGRISSRQFYEGFCRLTGTRPDYDALARASGDIFTLNVSILPLVVQLRAAGHRLGILSNTCEWHWNHCFGRYTFLREFSSIYLRSDRFGACKPDAAIFRNAAERAECPPDRIFYTDDIAGHVAAACGVGLDAVVYTSTAALADELRQRGVRFNY